MCIGLVGANICGYFRVAEMTFGEKKEIVRFCIIFVRNNWREQVSGE
jgi:hypothetical protein